MKIQRVVANNRKDMFELRLKDRELAFPFARLRVRPSRDNGITEVYADKEMGGRGFTYRLSSGEEDTIMLDEVLEYNKDPEYLCRMLLHKLTVKARQRLETIKIPKREIMRRMQTSAPQFHRLIDPSFSGKTIDEMVKLLAAMDCSVDVVLSDRKRTA